MRQLAKMYGPPPGRKRVEVDGGTVPRVNDPAFKWQTEQQLHAVPFDGSKLLIMKTVYVHRPKFKQRWISIVHDSQNPSAVGVQGQQSRIA